MNAPRTRKFLARAWDTIAVGLVTAVFFYASLDLGRAAGWVPRIVLALTFLFVLLRLVVELRNTRGAVAQASATTASEAPHPAQARTVGSLATAISWSLGLLLAIYVFGIASGSALYCLAYLRWAAGAGWRYTAIFALSLGVALYLVFDTLFDAGIYRGLLFAAG